MAKIIKKQSDHSETVESSSSTNKTADQDHLDNGNHYGHEHGNNGNHNGHLGDDGSSDINYADEKFGINMESYIQNAINNGATVLYGTPEVDYLNIGSENTVVYGLESADVISSVANNTILNGDAGRDVMYGIEYDDVINGGDDDDAIFGNDGSDILNGDAGDDQIYGGSGNDVINGGIGNDILYNVGNGDAAIIPGNDIMTGGEGNDRFAFFGYTLESQNVAKITDFTSGTDKILLIYFNSIDYTVNFEDSLVQGQGATAQDANDFLIFDSNSGALYYDADGNGDIASIHIATLTDVSALSAGDFAYSF